MARTFSTALFKKLSQEPGRTLHTRVRTIVFFTIACASYNDSIKPYEFLPTHNNHSCIKINKKTLFHSQIKKFKKKSEN